MCVCERQPLGAVTGSSPAHGQESSAPKLLWLSARKIFLQCICYGSARGPSGVATQCLSVQGKLSVASSAWMEIWVGGGSWGPEVEGRARCSRAGELGMRLHGWECEMGPSSTCQSLQQLSSPGLYTSESGNPILPGLCLYCGLESCQFQKWDSCQLGLGSMRLSENLENNVLLVFWLFWVYWLQAKASL